jgi:plasmid stability protein
MSSTLTIRNIDPWITNRLRMAAAAHGRSIDEEVRNILRAVLLTQAIAPATGLGSRIHARFAALDGVELDIPPRTDIPRSANFEDGR